ncbi:MAG: PA0069 family radical SAM protein [Methylobacterium sp.]|nr:PA0069 family radical SAM protein [Methylobacterium sp.]
MTSERPLVFKGRGTVSNGVGRFEALDREAIDDGWGSLDEGLPPLRTEVIVDSTRSIITWNDSPDIPFDRSINPYRGCEHGCTYCFARPTHTYLGYSAGLDFESRILIKPEAAALLRKELGKPGYRCGVMSLGTNTDPYQPLERAHRITRQILEVLSATNHPVAIVTKSALVERDIDLLAPMAALGLAEVFVSITTLDRTLSRTLEPRAAAPRRRLETLAALHAAGIPAGVMTAPVIPALNDHDLEAILEAARDAGARRAGYILLRLPHEVAPLFEQWLQQHVPLKAAHVMSLIRQSRGGKDYDATYFQRQRGTGQFAALLAQRFRLATRRLGLNLGHRPLDTSLFRPPQHESPQRGLFQ